MLAWTTTRGAPGGLTLSELAVPSPLPHELLVHVEAFAPNPGDLAALPRAPVGSIPGWDGAGIVLESAADGGGPQIRDPCPLPRARCLRLGVAPRGASRGHRHRPVRRNAGNASRRSPRR